jgi:hypothetical protein
MLLIDTASVIGLVELAVFVASHAMTASMEISGLAELADRGNAAKMPPADVASLSPHLSKYTQTTITLQLGVAAAVEEERRIRRRARIVWMGYVEVADQLTEIMAARDRRLDDRRLCVEVYMLVPAGSTAKSKASSPTRCSAASTLRKAVNYA